MSSIPRFTVFDPPHPLYPALIDWQVEDNGRRTSVDRLVAEANRLHRQLEKLKEELKMLAHLTDGSDILASRQVQSETELNQLNAEAQEVTEGNLWWQPALASLNDEEYSQEHLEALDALIYQR